MKAIAITMAAAAGAAVLALSVPAFAQELHPQSVITGEAPAGDTMKMTCAEARTMVRGKHGIVLSSGANHFDRYHSRDETCEKNEQVLDPAFVRTKDNPLCFIGYTCEDRTGD